ncbi:hypothetical protein ODZ84_12200 [Chryseobacterium fluminis]|uniref:hypothetical protein n=1 Tax=Chryseobacterium fluminis TaxID=2983606 RepID=UPI002258291A|nr:hypothetical protein [Chryseobacterium sp. MMS21-Ot14]UZT96002.1 hypothetical protein ODZ84_12200 [Chryseobacterium sp. MMS21-Ot14]
MMRKWYQDQEANLTDQSAYTDNSGTSLNHTGLEKLFFDTLGKMNINKDNMILQKIEDNGGINTISINSDGTTVQIPCP